MKLRTRLENKARMAIFKTLTKLFPRDAEYALYYAIAKMFQNEPDLKQAQLTLGNAHRRKVTLAARKWVLGKNENIYCTICEKNYAETNTGKIQNKPLSAEQAGHLYRTLALLHATDNLTPCLDRIIVAVIHDPDMPSMTWIGTNGKRNDQPICLRNEAKLKINQGYQLCKDACRQEQHAEVAAIKKWLQARSLYLRDPMTNTIINPHQATISVFGAKKMCNDCLAMCNQWGLHIKQVTPNLEELLKCL